MAQFMMNVMLASGGYPWTIIQTATLTSLRWTAPASTWI